MDEVHREEAKRYSKVFGCTDFILHSNETRVWDTEGGYDRTGGLKY